MNATSQYAKNATCEAMSKMLTINIAVSTEERLSAIIQEHAIKPAVKELVDALLNYDEHARTIFIASNSECLSEIGAAAELLRECALSARFTLAKYKDLT